LDKGWRRDGSFRKSGTLGTGAKANDESPLRDKLVAVSDVGDEDGGVDFLPVRLSHLFAR
jgi:hypothetical protein